MLQMIQSAEGEMLLPGPVGLTLLTSGTLSVDEASALGGQSPGAWEPYLDERAQTLKSSHFWHCTGFVLQRLLRGGSEHREQDEKRQPFFSSAHWIFCRMPSLLCRISLNIHELRACHPGIINVPFYLRLNDDEVLFSLMIWKKTEFYQQLRVSPYFSFTQRYIQWEFLEIMEISLINIQGV